MTKRCDFDGKKIFESKPEATKTIGRGNTAMNAYMGPCGYWHVGHRRGRKGPRGIGVGA